MNHLNIKVIITLSLSTVLLLCCVTSETRALTMKAYSLKELWLSADIVSLGYIQKREFKTNNGRLMTIYQLNVKHTFKSTMKSKLRNEISIVLPGGQNGQYQQFVPGIPQLKFERLYLSFLRCQPNGQCAPIGYGQGIWTPQLNDNQVWAPLIKDVHLMNDPSPLRPQSLQSLLNFGELTIGESLRHSPPSVTLP